MKNATKEKRKPNMDYTSMTDQQLTEALHKAVADNNGALTSECADHSRIVQTCIANEFNNRGRDAHVELVGVDSDCECDLHRAIRNENHPSITQYSIRMTRAYRTDLIPVNTAIDIILKDTGKVVATGVIYNYKKIEELEGYYMMRVRVEDSTWEVGYPFDMSFEVRINETAEVGIIELPELVNKHGVSFDSILDEHDRQI